MKLSITKAAVEFGVSKETIRRGLREQDIPESKDGYPLRVLFRAAGGDFKFERTRRERAEAESRELSNGERKRELIALEEARRAIAEVLAPVRQRIVTVPTEMANRCNPTDPEFARAALSEWRDETLRGIRADILK
jgi:hypothetical protein